MNGIDLNANPNGETPEEIVERLKRKADAMREGKTEEEFELNDIGLDIEVVEE